MKIRIRISKNGVEVDYEGFKGKTCIKSFNEVQEFLRAIGINFNIDSQELKPEYHEGEEEEYITATW